MMMRTICLALMLSLPFLGFAQSKVTAPTALWPELQLSVGAGENGLLFFRNQYRINTDSRFNDLRSSGVLSNFERVELALGYEHTFTDHWRGGALLRYAAEDFPKTLFYTLFLRHNGKIGSLYFNKQLLFEYTTQESRDAFGRFNGMAEIGKRLPVKAKYITPSVSYEAMVLSDFGSEDNNFEERTIDRTRLRLNLTYELNQKLRLTPYFMRQTDYYYVLVSPVYDDQGNLLEEGYTTKRNRISPVFGLGIKYNINKTAETASITY